MPPRSTRPFWSRADRCERPSGKARFTVQTQKVPVMKASARPPASRGPKKNLAAGGLVDLRGRRRALIAIGALVLLAVLVAGAKSAERPPSPVPASAPATEFSAGRAWRHLERIVGDEPTPIGSAGGDEVRDYLVDELSALGLDVEVQEGVGARTFDDSTVAGRVENVVATIPGEDPTGRVFLAAHYDTTFGAPGASDDKAAVAAMLETARALTGGERLRNDVVLLLTDGEEPGLLGAESFVEQHPYGAEGGVVLNWEATGNAGPSVLFETSEGNAALIEEFAASAPHPVGEAAMAELYEGSSQNTDFTVLKEEGFAVLNFAFIDGRAYYHGPRDTVDNFDQDSMHHHGAKMLALAGGVAAGLVPLVLAPVAAIGLWEVLVLIRPSYAGMGDPYRPELYRWALAALTAAIVVGWYALLRRRIGAMSMAVGAPAWPAVFGIAMAWLAPGLSYYGSLPATSATCGCLAALAIDEKRAMWRGGAPPHGAAAGGLLPPPRATPPV